MVANFPRHLMYERLIETCPMSPWWRLAVALPHRCISAPSLLNSKVY